MELIVDTNVPIVANRKAPQASLQCVLTCIQKLREIQNQHRVVLDKGWLILNEYKKNLSPTGQPSVGDAFYLWLLRNRSNAQKCREVEINQIGDDDFGEFPVDPALKNFDRADRKFVAVALAHPGKPPILNAVDSDWYDYESQLAVHGVKIEFLCPELRAARSK